MFGLKYKQNPLTLQRVISDSNCLIPLHLCFYIKYCDFTCFSGVEIFVETHIFFGVSGESPETLRKLCVSAKFSHQEIRWNFGILHTVTTN